MQGEQDEQGMTRGGARGAHIGRIGVPAALLPHVDVARMDGVALLGVEPPGDLAHHDAVKDGVGVADVVHAHDGAGGLLHGLVAARAWARAVARVCVQ